MQISAQGRSATLSDGMSRVSSATSCNYSAAGHVTAQGADNPDPNGTLAPAARILLDGDDESKAEAKSAPAGAAADAAADGSDSGSSGSGSGSGSSGSGSKENKATVGTLMDKKRKAVDQLNRADKMRLGKMSRREKVKAVKDAVVNLERAEEQDKQQPAAATEDSMYVVHVCARKCTLLSRSCCVGV